MKTSNYLQIFRKLLKNKHGDTCTSVGYLERTFFLYIFTYFSLREGTILNHDMFVKMNFYFHENTKIINLVTDPAHR
jgi:hypothetical protein